MELQFKKTPPSDDPPMLHPTPSYHPCSEIRSQYVQSPRPLRIILDLNGSLLFRHGNRNIDLRDEVKAFIHYMLQEHWVMTRSSATLSSVDKMLAKLLKPGDMKRFVGIWTRAHLELTLKQDSLGVQVYKQLS